jgi:hypothetical protein
MELRRRPLVVRRRLAALLLATVVAVGLGAAPPAVHPVLAAGPLRIAADATYVLDPDAGRVHVAIEFRATNLKPDSASFIYFYRDVAFAIQPDAKAIRATDAAGAISVTTRKREFYVETEVHLRANLYYQESTTFTVRYDLVGGAPRSDSQTRVGAAFATFGVWAWGDPDRSSVEVRTPAGYANEIDGGPMDVQRAAAGDTLRASPADPDTFYAIVSAENRAAYGSTRISLEGDIEIVVMAWPEDDAWDETVTETLRNGMPELLELIGLDWPVEDDLEVRERYSPALEGYAGFFFTDEQRIEVSEDLDPLVIVHEASHAWFNEDLFSDRWIYEGLAEEYSWRVQAAVGDDPGRPERPDIDDPGFVPLSAWSFPEVIRDQETDDRERFGYQAALWVVHQVVVSVGVDSMREAFAKADADLTAYPGAGRPETVLPRDGWRRFLDLAQSIDRPAQIDVDKALLDFVVFENDWNALVDRAETRDQYRLLLIDGEGWLPPWYVRRPMGEWRFDDAGERMDEAAAVLELRDRVATAADALQLEPDDALRTAYEGASEGFVAVQGIGDDQLEALAALADTRAKLDAEPDLVARIGLLGETPRASYDEARAAFERGELDSSLAAAAVAAAIVTGAAAVGEQRLLLAVGGAVVLLLVLLVLAVTIRRRRRRHRHALATAAGVPMDWGLGAPDPAAPGAAAPGAPDPAEPGSSATGPASTEPSDTLATDPGPASPPPSASPPDAEGGPG